MSFIRFCIFIMIFIQILFVVISLLKLLQNVSKWSYRLDLIRDVIKSSKLVPRVLHRILYIKGRIVAI